MAAVIADTPHAVVAHLECYRGREIGVERDEDGPPRSAMASA